MAGRDDIAFANDIRAALDQRTSGAAWLTVLIIALLLLSVVAWASWAKLEEVTTGEGRVIPSRQTQVVQTLEGGIVREILAREGDLVKAQQVLMRIDDTGFASRLGELRQKRWSMRAEIARLTAEANGKDSIQFDKELVNAAPRAIQSEKQAFAARKKQQAGEISVLRQQLLQRQQSLGELEANRRKFQATLRPIRRELQLTRNLKKKGAVPEIDVLRLEQKVAELEGELKVVTASLPRAKAAILEAELRISTVESAARAKARERLAAVRSELAVIDETLKAAKDRVLRTSLKAPVRGIVNKLNVTSLGSIVQPGRDIIEIVPLDDALHLETRIRPRDVAFIRPGQKASIKLTAYDFLIYGALEGSVERISADTISDQQGQPYYRVIVKTEQNHIELNDRRLPIIPGMVASVDIQTGEKTVLDYLLKPISRARYEALRER
ncbi:MAG: HlyD family type I secretion periplasmic adaptor subunit [Pseudomonadota bacterium]